jgi:hypothetical protein
MTKYQKAVYYQVIKLFIELLSHIKIKFDNPIKFKRILQKSLQENSFYLLNTLTLTKLSTSLESKYSRPTLFYDTLREYITGIAQ